MHKPDREVWKPEDEEGKPSWAQAMRDTLKSIPSIAEEDIEFYTRGLVFLLQKQQQDNRIPAMKFNRKFTALFRLYGPLLKELHGDPERLIRTYLMWENSFFNKVHLVHHRDSARTDHMGDIVRLANASDDELSVEIATLADKRLTKLEDQRKRTAELADKKKQKGKGGVEKKKLVINWDEEESGAMQKHTFAMNRYVKDVDLAFAELEKAASDSKVKNPTKLAKEQQHAKKCLGILRQSTAILQEKQGVPGAKSVKLKADDPLARAHWARNMGPLRLCNIITLTMPNMYKTQADVPTSEQSAARTRIDAIKKECAGLQDLKAKVTSGEEHAQEVGRIDDTIAALEAEESEMLLKTDGPFLNEVLESMKFLCTETRREMEDLDAQKKVALRTSKEQAKVWLASLVQWGETIERFQEQSNEDYQMMAEELSLIERFKQYTQFVQELTTDGKVDLAKWEPGSNTLDQMYVFERRVVVAREKPKTKKDWKSKQQEQQDGRPGQPAHDSHGGEDWRAKNARLEEERKKKQEEEARQREAELGNIEIGSSSDDEDEMKTMEPAFMKEFAKGKVEKDEVLLTRAEFREYDQDDSGEIEFEEFKALVRDKGWIYALTDAELQLAWGRIDTDGGGSISYEELQEWWSKGPGDRFKNLQADGKEKQQLEWAVKQFRKHDADGNESLDPREFEGLHAELVEAGLVTMSLRETLSVLDRDGDGEIHIAEFIVWLVDSANKDAKKAVGIISSSKSAARTATDESTNLAALAALGGDGSEAAALAALEAATAVPSAEDEAEQLAMLNGI